MYKANAFSLREPTEAAPAIAPPDAPPTATTQTREVVATPKAERPRKPKFVVGLGASAGGLEALERFFDKVPTDSGGAFIVVMHLARDFRSVLDELLARHTTMPVLAIREDTEIAANAVYVIQPGTEIEVVGETFRIAARASAAMSARLSSIDLLLQSIAASWGELGAGVILSGSGSDGAQGVIAISAAGGVAFAQSPESAKFDSMPISAIGTHCVSAVDAPEALAHLVVESISLPRVSLATRRSSSEASALQAILGAVVGASQLDATQYTQSTFERRVQRRMRELEIKSISAYSELVRADDNEARALSETLLIGVTDFFRDDAAFSALARHAAPELIRRARDERRPVRVWTPGCASGEEPYSIAILLAEAANELQASVEIQIFASDVHKGLLAEAARGEYPSERLVNVSEERRRNFFTRSPSGLWQIAPWIRKNIVFATHDVLVDPPFTRLDLVSCRNLLIYFSVEAQQRVIGSFAFGLLEKGFLFLGASETVGAQRQAFEFVDERRRLFRRNRALTRGPSFPRPMESAERLAALAPIVPARRSLKMRETFLQPIYSALLKDFAPPSLLVSPAGELLHTFGDMRRFLRAPEGVVRLDVTDMCDPALKTPLAAGIDRVLRDKAELTFARIELQEFPEKGKLVDVALRPLFVDPDTIFVLVTIVEYAKPAATVGASEPLASDSRTSALELEVMRTREALQSTIEEIETTNEQLKSANEELMASNEELQSTNEELSSLNEELHSVNVEHFRQNNELVRLTRDFDALLHATEIGVLFLDETLAIRRFTRLIFELFQFADSDIGRSIRTFRTPFVDFDLESFLLRVMRRSDTEEVEVQDHALRSWLLRAASYPDQKGVVLSVISISRMRDAGISSLNARERIFANAAPYVGDALIVVAPDTGHVLYANRRAFVAYGVPESPAETFEISRITPEWGSASWTSWLSTISLGANAHRLDVHVIDQKRSVSSVDMQATILRDGGETRALVRLVENFSRAEAVRELQERARHFAISNRELEQFASVVAHDLRAPLRHLTQFADFLQTELREHANANVREYLGIIQSSAANLTGMVDRLLDYARIGVGPPKFAPVKLTDCISRASELLAREIARAKLEVGMGKAASVKGDAMLLARLFQNLLQNALKYARPGVTPEIRIYSRFEGDFVVVTVEDNGIGVDPIHADEIFKMFTRLHSETEYSGHGMGLAICKRICDAHGGSIALDPTRNEGARFTIKLPRVTSRSLKAAKA